MSLPPIVTREEWRAARVELLAEEKAMTRARDALNTKRRELPMVRIDTDYEFTGPDGRADLHDLFEGRPQLIVAHFMFDPSWDDGCPSCTAGADEMAPGLLEHLRVRDTTLAYVSRAPIEKIERYKAKRGWTFPWYSSYGSDFNYDFGVTIDPGRGRTEYNFAPIDADEPFEMPGRSHFLRVDGQIFHTNSIYARGLESAGGSYYFLDETVLGRQEDWEEPKGRSDDVRTATPNFQS